MRAMWGASQFMPASRFLDEIPESVLDVARAGSTLSGAGFASSGGYGGGSSFGAGYGGRRGLSFSGGLGGGRRDVNRPSFGSGDRKSTRLNSSHVAISYAVFCLKKKRR